MTNKKSFLLAAALLGGTSLALAKLPPPDDAAKAKAAETAAKAAWQAKVDNFQLCKAQDRVAAMARKTASKPMAAASAKVTTPAAAATAAASTPGMSAPTGVPVASAPPACSDPGPFAYAPPEQKPLESAGAHSPAATAKSPPSVPQTSAEMAPAQKATAASKQK
jgi:hypothetical protein